MVLAHQLLGTSAGEWRRSARKSDVCLHWMSACERVCLLVCLILGPVGLAGAEEISNKQSLGPVEARTTLSPSNPRIGDQVTFTLEIQAAEGVEILSPEFGGSFSGQFDIVSFTPRSKILDDGSQLQTQTYELQLMTSGEHSIAPISIEFVDNRPGQKPAPDDFDAYELLTERIDFQVESFLPASASTQLKPPLPALELPVERPLTSYLLPIVAAFLLFAAGAGAFLWNKQRKRSKRANAYEIARNRLTRLLNDRNSPNPALSIEQFFVEISGIIRRYLEDRFEVRAPDLTTDEFLQLAASKSDLTREHQSLLGEFLQQADIVKFAGIQASSEDVRRSSDLAVRFLEETRANAPEIEVDDEATSDAGAARTREPTHV